MDVTDEDRAFFVAASDDYGMPGDGEEDGGYMDAAYGGEEAEVEGEGECDDASDDEDADIADSDHEAADLSDGDARLLLQHGHCGRPKKEEEKERKKKKKTTPTKKKKKGTASPSDKTPTKRKKAAKKEADDRDYWCGACDIDAGLGVMFSVSPPPPVTADIMCGGVIPSAGRVDGDEYASDPDLVALCADAGDSHWDDASASNAAPGVGGADDNDDTARRHELAMRSMLVPDPAPVPPDETPMMMGLAGPQVQVQPRRPVIAVGVDFGRDGFAYCIMDIGVWPPVVIRMHLEPYVGIVNKAVRACDAMSAFYNRISAFRPQIFVLEEQPGINHDTDRMEAALGGYARGRGAIVCHAPTRDVSNEFELRASSHEEKKITAVGVARRLLCKSSTALQCQSRAATLEFDFMVRLLDMVERARKLGRKELSKAKRIAEARVAQVYGSPKQFRAHDMADALLNVLWYARMRRGMLEMPPVVHKTVDRMSRTPPARCRKRQPATSSSVSAKRRRPMAGGGKAAPKIPAKRRKAAGASAAVATAPKSNGARKRVRALPRSSTGVPQGHVGQSSVSPIVIE